MENILSNFFNVDIMVRTGPLLLSGLWMTAQICAAVIVVGAAGGLILALCSLSPQRRIRWPAIVFTDIFRSFPPLVLLIFVYSGFPFAGIELSPLAAVVLAFFINNSAYFSEVYRGAIQALPHGQSEAARATGLTRTQEVVHVILPQAIRNAFPDLLSNAIEVIKLTSLASVVSLAELVYSANMARSVTYNATPLVMAAIIYLVLLWPLVRVLSLFERPFQN